MSGATGTNAETRVDVLAERRGSAGLITLNRPKALNALSLPMIRALSTALLAWRDDPAVHVVAIRGSNKKGQPGTPESLFGGICGRPSSAGSGHRRGK